MAKHAGLIAGLGNPGPGYANTRHNMGFMALDALVEAIGSEKSCKAFDCGGDCVAASCLIMRSRPRYVLIKPMSYMNRSGIPVARASGRLELDPKDLIVIHDEMDLPLGRIKLKYGGGTAGHNGVASIAEHLGTTDFYRLRLGIGRPEYSGQAADYVLERFDPGELETAEKTAKAAAQGLRIFAGRGYEQAAQFINSYRLDESKD